MVEIGNINSKEKKEIQSNGLIDMPAGEFVNLRWDLNKKVKGPVKHMEEIYEKRPEINRISEGYAQNWSILSNEQNSEEDKAFAAKSILAIQQEELKYIRDYITNLPISEEERADLLSLPFPDLSEDLTEDPEPLPLRTDIKPKPLPGLDAYESIDLSNLDKGEPQNVPVGLVNLINGIIKSRDENSKENALNEEGRIIESEATHQEIPPKEIGGHRPYTKITLRKFGLPFLLELQEKVNEVINEKKIKEPTKSK